MRSSWSTRARVTLPDGTVHDNARMVMRSRVARLYTPDGAQVAEMLVTSETLTSKRPRVYELGGEAGLWTVQPVGCGCGGGR